LNHYDEEAFGPYTGNLIKDSFKGSISSYERIGKYTDAEGNNLDILIVHLCRDCSLAYARTMQRNFIAWYLNGGRGGEQRDAALVAIVSPSRQDWRFSLVRMDYKLENTPVGKIKAREEFTPARRYSFLVGSNEKSHTAQQNLVPLLIKEVTSPTFVDIEQAFNIEKVSDEFFEKYKELFNKVNKAIDDIINENTRVRFNFEQKGINTTDFSKKLLGQIVFLYFLQKKGWFGVARDTAWGGGPKDFIRSLFDKRIAHYTNFFNDILEPLFYEALAIERSGDFYSRFNCKIPFLNGGLFDPINGYDWIHTDILLPNELFSNENHTTEGDSGDGILDIFDRYNFTVCEDEPLEKEVAIDPEMLGKVFERLLEVKDRKSKGSYYTPREIVHYMCQESLIQHLVTELTSVSKEDIALLIHHGDIAIEHETVVGSNKSYSFKLPESIRTHAATLDRVLTNVRVCDPAVGSGAFLVGMMHEIVRARLVLCTYLNKQRLPYEMKRHAIQNCLYGVDIEPGAVEIAKLRLWLSLVVDEEDIRQIKPLPNLDYKIMQGNSLLEEYEGIKLFDESLLASSAVSTKTLLKELEARRSNIQQEYFEIKLSAKPDRVRLDQLEQEIKEIADGIKKLKIIPPSGSQGGLWDSAEQARQKAYKLKKLHTLFFDESQVKEKESIRRQIDTVEWDLIETTLHEHGKTAALQDIQRLRNLQMKPFFLWKLHFAEVFHEKDGFDITIANPPYIFARDSKKKGMTDKEKSYYYQKYNLAEYQVNVYPLFIEKGSQLLKPNGLLCFITPNNWLTINTNQKLRKFVLEQSDIIIVNFYAKVFVSAAVDSAILVFKKSSDHQHVALYEYTNGFNFIREANSSDLLEQRDFIINIGAFKCDGVSDIIRKIDTLSTPLSSLATVRAGLKAYETGTGTPPQTDVMKKERVYHSRHKVDSTYLKYLDGRDVCRYRIGWGGEYLKYGDNLAAPRKDFRLYSTERILVRQIPAKPPYCIHACLIDEVALNDLNSVNVIGIMASPICILAILNSRLTSFWFIHKFGKMQRETFPQFKVNELASFPIPKNFRNKVNFYLN
jgi:hypothetical protein